MQRDKTTYTRLMDGKTSRRSALRTLGIGGAATFVATRGVGSVAAQDASPVAGSDLTAYPEVALAATEYRFDLPATIPAGLTRLTMLNQGAEDHHAMFMQINEGSTWADFEAAMQQPDFGALFAVSQSLGGPGSIAPGEQSTVIADLPEGQYAVICAIPGPDGMPHYAMGMVAPLEVTAATATATPPTADGRVELVDFAFDMMPMQVPTGPQIWEVPNAGEQLHELVVFQLAPGVTPEEFAGIIAGGPEATPVAGEAAPMATPAAIGGPPGTSVTGVAPMSPGLTNWLAFDLEPAEYVAICFVPDPESGAPHFALGMIMPFTVA